MKESIYIKKTPHEKLGITEVVNLETIYSVPIV